MDKGWITNREKQMLNLKHHWFLIYQDFVSMWTWSFFFLTMRKRTAKRFLQIRKMFSWLRVLANRLSDYLQHDVAGNGFIRGQQTVSTKGQIVNISSFVGWSVSVTSIQLHLCSLETAQNTKKMIEHSWVTIKLYFRTLKIWNSYNYHLPPNIILLLILTI